MPITVSNGEGYQFCSDRTVSIKIKDQDILYWRTYALFY